MERQDISAIEAREMLATGEGVIVNGAALERLFAERDQLRAEVERLRGEVYDALTASGANSKAWQECVEESAIKRTHLLSEIGLTEQQRDAALARTSASAGARLKAEALREAVDTFPNREGGEIWETSFTAWVLHEADRLAGEAEKEAANGR